ncbi:hypothetical protein [Phenylobacterium sp.]|jgi:hypothetical protein|uniref:hypothetical protein n=1 Tax=Phenylobacterium sp. TaxID=1871053 RepID=UPI002F955D58
MKTITAAAIAVLAFAAAGSALAADKGWSPPRTADGKPDLGGVWSNAALTNLQRPPGVAKLVVSKAEAEALVKANPFMQLIEAESGESNPDDALLDDGNADRGYNAFWIDPGKMLGKVKGEYRTSWIVEPASGQMPLTDEGRKRVAAVRAERQKVLFHGPEALPIPERCLIGFSGSGGPGMLNPMYNNNYHIVQTPGAVVIDVEMVHDARIVPIAASKAAAQAMHGPVPKWLGDSVGWWEGDTLVVETVNVNPQQARSGPIYLTEKGKVTERFTRVGKDEIFYEFTVEDPVYYSQPWRAELALNGRKELVYEYACHEGNYAMPGILAGARKDEAEGRAPSLGPGIFGTPIPKKTGQQTQQPSGAAGGGA